MHVSLMTGSLLSTRFKSHDRPFKQGILLFPSRLRLNEFRNRLRSNPLKLNEYVIQNKIDLGRVKMKSFARSKNI